MSRLGWRAIILVAGVVSRAGLAAAEYRQDQGGGLAPRMSYALFIERGMGFVLKDVDNGWASGNAYKDQDGKPIPAYINYALANDQRQLGVGHPVNANTVYPAFHHALYIRAFLAHWRKTNDPACLARARQIGDWNLERRTLAEWKYGNLFYSTACQGKMGGSVDADAVMTDKTAIMALAMIELAEATGDPRYRQAAEQVGATLAKTQLPTGNWPFRVNPQTGEVREDYTSSAIYAVMLFEALDGKDGARWSEAKAKTLKWILENPAKTMLWRGFYEDIPSKYTNNRTNWDCIDTARWLVAHRAENPDYLPLALRLNDWIIKEFGDPNPAWAPALGIREQKSCFHTMGVHTLHWAALQADLHAATGDAAFTSRALNACALVTHWMRPDNAITVGPTWKNEIWFSCHLGAVLYMYDTLSRYPDAAAAETAQKLVRILLAKEATFEGTDKDTINLGDLALRAPATLCFSIRPGDAAPDRRILCQTSGATTQAGALRLAAGQLQIWDGGRWQPLTHTPIPTGEWTDISVVFGADGGVTALRDGKPGPTVTSRMDFSGVSASLGGKFLGEFGEPFLGSIKSVRLENLAIPFQAAAVPKTVDWESMMTVAPVKRDAQGRLLPLQSYEETIRRGMSFLLMDHLKWFKGPADSILDEQGQTQMPWVYYSNLQHNGAPFPNSVDRFVSYPAFHHALNIRTFLEHWRRTQDGRALAEAVKLADWNIAHSTPVDWPYGGFPYSTFEAKKPGGFRDHSGLMPDKAAIMALAYLDLYEATKEPRLLKAAQTIGEKLASRQRPNGTWPFRVDPQTEKVVEEYTSSVIYAVRLFEKLDKANGNQRFKPRRDLTWNWLVNGPIQTKEFRGFYEDIPPSPDGRTNYDCLDTIRYLLANRTADNGYLEMAKDLNAWIEKTFMDKIKGFEPAEGIREQLQCNVVMGIHSLNWAGMLLELARATGDEPLRQRAIQTANYVTYYLQPDNRIVVGFQYSQWWYSCHTGVILYLLEFENREL